MTTHARRPSTAMPSDLLPWADPYILQLFTEAALAEAQAPTGKARDAGSTCVAGRGEAVAEARFDGDAWAIIMPHSAIARRQRTGSARQLAPC
jgi:hypothetical protein